MPRTSVTVILDGRQQILPIWKRRFDRRIAAVRAGDVLLLRVISARILGQIRVRRTIFYDHPTHDDTREIRQRFQQAMNVPAVFFQDREAFFYLWLIFLDHPTQLLFPQKPPLVTGKSWLRVS